MVLSVSRGGTIAAALAAVTLASTLAACASSNSVSPAANGKDSGTAQSAPMIPAPSPSASASPTGSMPVNPGGRMSPAPSSSPVAQLTAPPANAKYVPIDQESQSADGRTLSLQIEARGGACGQYVVVVKESAAQVGVGLAQLPVRKGVMCPMYIGPRIFTATLASPVGTRIVVDLANGARLGG